MSRHKKGKIDYKTAESTLRYFKDTIYEGIIAASIESAKETGYQIKQQTNIFHANSIKQLSIIEGEIRFPDFKDKSLSRRILYKIDCGSGVYQLSSSLVSNNPNGRRKTYFLTTVGGLTDEAHNMENTRSSVFYGTDCSEGDKFTDCFIKHFHKLSWYVATITGLTNYSLLSDYTYALFMRSFFNVEDFVLVGHALTRPSFYEYSLALLIKLREKEEANDINDILTVRIKINLMENEFSVHADDHELAERLFDKNPQEHYSYGMFSEVLAGLHWKSMKLEHYLDLNSKHFKEVPVPSVEEILFPTSEDVVQLSDGEIFSFLN